jgi:molybdenum cofactor biosynthesis protein B
VLTVSDTRSLGRRQVGRDAGRADREGRPRVGARAIVTDDVEKIRAQVKAWIADPAST